MSIGVPITRAIANVARPLGEVTRAAGKGVVETFACFNDDRNSKLQDPRVMRAIPAILKVAPPGYIIDEEIGSPYEGLAVNPRTNDVRFPRIRIPEGVTMGGLLEEIQALETKTRDTHLGVGILFFLLTGIGIWSLLSKGKKT